MRVGCADPSTIVIERRRAREHDIISYELHALATGVAIAGKFHVMARQVNRANQIARCAASEFVLVVGKIFVCPKHNSSRRTG